MQAVVIEKPCKAQDLRLSEVPIPQVKPGWVLVKIKAFGLNFAELLTREGRSPSVTFPRIIGIECVGEVADPSDSEFAKGQRVISMTGGLGREYDGSYAEYTLIPQDRVYPAILDWDWPELAAIPEMVFTAYASLSGPLQLKSGEILLIRGGTSSVGLTALKLAKAMGANVIATTRNPDKAKLLQEAGADQVLIDDGNISSTQDKSVNKVLELIGTKTLKDSLKTLLPGGIACMTGLLAKEWVFDSFEPMENISSGTYLTSFSGASAWPEIAQEMQEFLKNHNIAIKPAKVFELAEIAKAHEYQERGQAGGKIVIVNPTLY